MAGIWTWKAEQDQWVKQLVAIYQGDCNDHEPQLAQCMVSLFNCVQCLLSGPGVVKFKHFELPFLNSCKDLADLKGLKDEDDVDDLVNHIRGDEVRSVAKWLDIVSVIVRHIKDHACKD